MFLEYKCVCVIISLSRTETHTKVSPVATKNIFLYFSCCTVIKHYSICVVVKYLRIIRNVIYKLEAERRHIELCPSALNLKVTFLIILLSLMTRMMLNKCATRKMKWNSFWQRLFSWKDFCMEFGKIIPKCPVPTRSAPFMKRVYC